MGRRTDSGASVNLFPFLSILVAIIGCLTLIIVVVTVTSMNKVEGKTPDEVVRAREFLQLEKEREEDQAEQDKMRQLLENLIQQNKDTIAARDRLKMLKEMLDNKELIEEDRNELIVKYNLLSQTNEQLEADHQKLLEEIKIKEEEIARRKLPPKPASLRVTGVGSTSTSKPYFVEVGNQALYIHRSLTKEPVSIPIGSLHNSKEFVDLLKEISSNPRHKLNFLIRGDAAAVKGFNTALGLIGSYNQANGTKIIPGKLPLPNAGEVDLQAFAQFLEP